MIALKILTISAIELAMSISQKSIILLCHANPRRIVRKHEL